MHKNKPGEYFPQYFKQLYLAKFFPCKNFRYAVIFFCLEVLFAVPLALTFASCLSEFVSCNTFTSVYVLFFDVV